MIEIPEEKLLKDITDLLLNELPKVLLELEEQSEDGIRLPPFRYVGLEEKMPVGTGLPYAFVEIEEGEYTEKDRIVKNVMYKLKIMVKPQEVLQLWRYYGTIKETINHTITYGWRIVTISINQNFLINLYVNKI